MSPSDLRKECQDALASGSDRVEIITTKRPRGFPRGELKTETPKGKLISYDARRVLNWLEQAVMASA